MKKIALYTLGIAFLAVFFSACNASKKGCGLTSDANKMEQSTSHKAMVKAEV
ncbi:MAG: hypothetical protein Q8K04_09040 [Lutibacter sp.]|nr:hypothetical protein [Lutibacter sp.]MDP3945515.1 hypothetical protein [Lutibacter sp.]